MKNRKAGTLELVEVKSTIRGESQTSYYLKFNGEIVHGHKYNDIDEAYKAFDVFEVLWHVSREETVIETIELYKPLHNRVPFWKKIIGW